MINRYASAKPYLLSLLLSSGLTAVAQGSIFLNELVASNQEGAEDEAGQTEDWIELYNSSDASVSLAGYTLSDDPERLDKWAFPVEAAVPARGFLVVWADEDQEDGPLHANFKLARAGESVTLTDANGTQVDAVTFPELEADVAYARRRDGASEFVVQAPTFAAANDGTSSLRASRRAYAGLTLWPNPALPGDETVTVAVPAGVGALRLTDVIGRTIWSKNLVVRRRDSEVPFATTTLTPGYYVLTARGDAGRRSTVLVVR